MFPDAPGRLFLTLGWNFSNFSGVHKGFIARLSEVAAHVKWMHCILHREHLATKSLGEEMHEVLNVLNMGKAMFFQVFVLTNHTET